MMNYGNMQGPHQGMQHGMGHEGMHHGMHGGMHQVEPIVCPPEYCVRDEFMPREVPVIHPVVNVNRQHYVDIPRHYYTETTEDVMGAPVMGYPGYGPGGFGCGCGHGHGHGCGCGRRF